MNEIVNWNGQSVKVQYFNDQGASVIIATKKSTDQRFARISYTGRFTYKGIVTIPIDMLSLAAGKDAWMRHIKFACKVCKQWYPADFMQCELCVVCYDNAETENKNSDGK